MRPVLVVDVCGQAECTRVATHRMFWPGSQPSFICPEHMTHAKAVAEACGFELVVEPIRASRRAR